MAAVVFALACGALSISLFVSFTHRNQFTGELDWDALLFAVLFGAFALSAAVVLLIGREPDRAIGRAGQVFGWGLFGAASIVAMFIAFAVISDPGY